MKSKEKEQAIVLRKNGESIPEISKKLKVSKGTVSLWVRHIDITDEQRKRIGGELVFNKRMAIQMFKNNISYSDMAEILGIKKTSLTLWFNRNGYSRRYKKYEFCEICGQ